MAGVMMNRLPPNPASGPAASPIAVRELLFASDLSPRCDSALDHAGLLAERLGAHLTLFHAAQLPKADVPGIEQELWRRAEAAAREHLKGRAEALGVTPTIEVERAAAPDAALVERLRRAPPDLTVVVGHGRQGLAHVVSGSVTETVLEATQRPLLCVREPEHGAALPYRRVLVPTDLTLPSRRVFGLAAAIARAFDAEVLALHTAPLGPLPSLSGVPEVLEASLPQEYQVADYLMPEFAGLRVAARLELGPPLDAILRTARAERPDLIALTTHGHDSLADRWLGSLAEHVLREAPCPVLVA